MSFWTPASLLSYLAEFFPAALVSGLAYLFGVVQAFLIFDPCSLISLEFRRGVGFPGDGASGTMGHPLAGISPKKIEIEPGTVVNFWVPTQTTTKPAVVFLHGFAFDGILTWQFQALALANRYSVYVPDFVFFGDSITDKSERSVEFQAECIAKGLKKLGVEKCTLVSFSYGGAVGFKMAEIYPELVHSLVVTCFPMALTDSISNARFHRLGFNSWQDYLLPDSVKGVETLVQLASHSFPKLPNFIYKEILEYY
ncbi:uncharacterized protein [Gossypium hirsutum]|uniref:AB hydrolase-1 domain-containing protein n=1 Tax=Gossypium hirsutum TaxID=3635 RepID=A0ABM3B9T7_GOSHI|nr:uncharacterized protein LOC121224479 [Gossypium hirsutum]